MGITQAERPAVTVEAVTGPLGRPLCWVKVWAFGGVVWLGFCAYSATRWLAGGYAKPVGPGPDPVPDFMKVSIWVWTVILALVCVAAIYYAIYRPWRRDGQIGSDGALVIALTSLWSQDPAMNYSQMYFAYNSYSPNLGCPQCFMPGWQSHTPHIPENFIAVSVYIGLTWFVVVAGCRLMTWMHSRWSYRRLLPILVLFLGAVVFDIATEAAWILPGVYSYPGATEGPLTLFKGTYYQFPLVELFLAGCWYAAFTSLRYFKDDQGQMFVEKGLSNLRATNRQKTVLRTLALIGGCNVIMLGIYNGPLDWVSRHWNTTAESIYTKSYWVQDNCGPRSQYACPDSRLPMQISPNNLYVRPDGTVIPSRHGIPDQTAK